MSKVIYVPSVQFSATEATLKDLATDFVKGGVTISNLCYANMTVALVEMEGIIRPISSFRIEDIPVRIIASRSNDYNTYSVFLAIHKTEKPCLNIDSTKRYILHITNIDIIDNQTQKLVYREGVSIISQYGQTIITDYNLDREGFIAAPLDFYARIIYFRKNLETDKITIDRWVEKPDILDLNKK